MSGVRFLSTVLAIFVTFLWAGFVVNAWQKNEASRLLAQTQIKDSQGQTDLALAQADEMARAANEEFTKHIQVAEAKILKTVKVEKKKLAIKPVVKEDAVTVVTPQSQEEKAKLKSSKDLLNKDTALAKVRAVEKEVAAVKEKTKSKNKTLSVSSARAIDTPSLIKTVKAKNAQEDVKVATLEKRFVKDESRISTDNGGTSDDRYAPIKLAQKRMAIATTKKEVMTEVVDEDAGSKEDKIESKIETRLSILTLFDNNSSSINHNVARAGKDNSRLSKDRVVVAVNKHQQVSEKSTETKVNKKQVEVTEDKKDEEKVVAKAKPIWTVPTGVTPEYTIVEHIERGLDSVAEAAVVAGNKITEKMVSLGNNVKGAIASPKKWEVPTGVTPGEDTSGQIAVVETSKIKKSEVKINDSKKDEVAVVAPKVMIKSDVKTANKTADKSLSMKKSEGNGENEVYVSSQLDDYDGAKILDGGVDKKVAVNTKEEKDPKSGGLMKRIINLFDTDKLAKDKNKKAKSKDFVSRVDKVRIAAIKHLMVEDVEYKFINKKKGQGQIVITGRSQADAKLSLYVDVRYLGDVIADTSGNWIFTKELYIPRGKHILQAQQMSKSGIAVARKTLPFVQKQHAKAPKGYKEGIGIDLGDKALATLRTKLKKDKNGGKTKLTAKEKAAERKAKRNKALAARTPLPVRKLKDKALASSLKGKEVKVAMLDKKSASKSKVSAATKAKEEKAKIAVVSKTAKKAQAPKYYIVKAGDTLGRIAKRNLGNSRAYKKILKLNKNLKSANKIYPGQKLLISEGAVQVADAKAKVTKVAALPSAKVKLPKKKVVEKKKAKAAGPSTYVVKRGDSLWKIAAKVYGNGRKYKELIKLNPKLLKNPASIKPNIKLRVKSS